MVTTTTIMTMLGCGSQMGGFCLVVELRRGLVTNYDIVSCIFKIFVFHKFMFKS